MADVFISYSRLDHDEVKPIADRLLSLGYNVRWDKAERSRQGIIDQRERELDASSVILVVWSDNAQNSAQVQAEAAHALDSGKLLAVKIEAVTPPFPFAAIQAYDVAGAGGWGLLEQALARRAQGPIGTPVLRQGLGLLTVLPAAGAPVLATLALAATLAAYSGAVSAAVNGVMTPGQLQIALIGMSFVGALSAALAGFRLFSTLRAR